MGRKEKKRLDRFGVNLMRSQQFILIRAAQDIWIQTDEVVVVLRACCNVRRYRDKRFKKPLRCYAKQYEDIHATWRAFFWFATLALFDFLTICKIWHAVMGGWGKTEHGDNHTDFNAIW